MCFSAPASGAVGTALLVGGILTMRQVRRPADMALASLPMLLGIQQLVEGALWRELDSTGGQASSPLVAAYLGFALVLWPSWVPYATWRVEPDRRRRRAIAAIGIVGAAVSIYLATFLVVGDITARAEAHRIVYDLPSAATSPSALPYVVATCLPCLLSSLRSVNVFGVAVVVSAAVAHEVYARAFVSVWCFMAAMLSAIVLAHVLREDHERRGWFTDAGSPRSRQAD
jgi:hypothetical protein